MFFTESDAFREKACEQLVDESKADLPLTLESLQAFLRERFPERKHCARSTVAELADELLQFDVTTIGGVEKIVDVSREPFAEHEKGRKAGPFYDVGVVRVSFWLVDKR